MKTLPVTDRQREVLLELPSLFGPYGSTLNRARTLCLNKKMEQALDRLSGVFQYFACAGYDDMVQLDFGFTSHMAIIQIWSSGFMWTAPCIP